MALHYQLPIYKASYELLLQVFQFSAHFNKSYKYTIGEQLKQETITLLTNIYRANCRREKRPLLEAARENIEVIRLYLRILKDLKQISLSKFIAINQQIESVSKQLTGWYKAN